MAKWQQTIVLRLSYCTNGKTREKIGALSKSRPESTLSSVSDSTPSRQPAPQPTPARISLGLTGPSVPTSEHLRFQLDHALARDAVNTQLDTTTLQQGLRDRGLQPLLLHTNAADRKTYLRRPDLGRTLHPDSVTALQSATDLGAPSVDFDGWGADTSRDRILFILADGLSALALERHALPLLDATLPLLDPGPWALTPVLTHARVAIGDEIGSILSAKITVLLIGERPGLSSPDSLGVYITWNPHPGCTDAERNCISNIRAEGLSYAEAATRIAHYISEAHRLQTTGIALKDPSGLLLPTTNL
jgi:ethanolamine ammonia-lyase small subunit